MISYWRILTLSFLVTLLVFFWDLPLLIPFKVFVIFLHEISHALGALITGGQVSEIAISWDESGFTKTTGGNFLAIASAGYLGSILWGSMLLWSSLKKKYIKTATGITGIFFLFFTAGYPGGFETYMYFLGLAWAFIFLACSFFFQKVNRLLLFFMGGLSSLYAVYDLGDFFRGDVIKTDAGIIAKHYFNDTSIVLPVAYFIGIFLSALSLWIFIKLVYNAIYINEADEDDFIEEAPHENEIFDQIDPQTLELLKLLQLKQKAEADKL
ncbi:MAG: M50 family metallopeptidase [Spirochaetia bacterium]|nr:M50 family metallopeptidase [Spirochaetia bacterium]